MKLDVVSYANVMFPLMSQLPYWEYQAVQGDTAKEMEYCQSLL